MAGLDENSITEYLYNMKEQYFIMMGKKIAEGAMSEVFLYDTNKIIKLYRSDNGYSDLEYSNSLVLWNLGIATPRPYERINVGKRPGIVYEYIQGRDFTGELIKNPAYQARRMAKCLYDFNIHIPDGSHLLKELRSFETNFRIDLDKPTLLAPAEKDKVLKHFLTLPHVNALYHGDFNATNLLVSNDKIYVIDFISLSIGNPLADVMEMILLYKYKVIPDRFPQEFKDAFYKERQTILTNFVDEYIRLSGFSYSDLQAWFLPVAAMQLSVGNIDSREADVLAHDIRLELLEHGSVNLNKCTDVI